MALKNNWNDLVDGESFVEVEPINRIAHAVIANEENILSVQNLGESIQADNESQEARINELSEDLIRFESDAVRRDSKINENEKRITNLEKGIPSDLFLTDSSIAYSKNVPQNALPYAEVRKIGGVTRKCTNLLPYPYDDTTHTVNGITFTDNGDGTVTANGTATANATYFFKNYSLSLPSGQYTISGLPFGGSWSTSIIQLASQDGFAFNHFSAQGDSFTLDNAVDDIVVVLVLFEGYTANNLVFKPMLNQGTTALPYEPYFEGLRSAPVTEVESVGANLLDLDSTTFWYCVRYGDTIRSNINGAYYSALRIYTKSEWILSMRGKPITFSVKENNGKSISIVIYGTRANGSTYQEETSSNRSVTMVVADDFLTVDALELRFNRSTSPYTDTTSVFEELMLYDGTEALPYRPYQHDTLPIPEAVQALDGYGDGVSESVYNYIDFETKQFVKRVGKVDLGTLSWSRLNETTWDANAPTNMECLGNDVASVIKSARYATVYANMISTKVNSVGLANDTANTITPALYVRCNNGSTTEKPSGDLVYKLATAEITDISDLLPEDNFIGVEGNGTITMINQYKYNVPSEIVFMLNEV